VHLWFGTHVTDNHGGIEMKSLVAITVRLEARAEASQEETESVKGNMGALTEKN
jgi:hypothetical protein